MVLNISALYICTRPFLTGQYFVKLQYENEALQTCYLLLYSPGILVIYFNYIKTQEFSLAFVLWVKKAGNIICCGLLQSDKDGRLNFEKISIKMVGGRESGRGGIQDYKQVIYFKQIHTTILPNVLIHIYLPLLTNF